MAKKSLTKDEYAELYHRLDEIFIYINENIYNHLYFVKEFDRRKDFKVFGKPVDFRWAALRYFNWGWEFDDDLIPTLADMYEGLSSKDKFAFYYSCYYGSNLNKVESLIRENLDTTKGVEVFEDMVTVSKVDEDTKEINEYSIEPHYSAMNKTIGFNIELNTKKIIGGVKTYHDEEYSVDLSQFGFPSFPKDPYISFLNKWGEQYIKNHYVKFLNLFIDNPDKFINRLK